MEAMDRLSWLVPYLPFDWQADTKKRKRYSPPVTCWNGRWKEPVSETSSRELEKDKQSQRLQQQLPLFSYTLSYKPCGTVYLFFLSFCLSVPHGNMSLIYFLSNGGSFLCLYLDVWIGSERHMEEYFFFTVCNLLSLCLFHTLHGPFPSIRNRRVEERQKVTDCETEKKNASIKTTYGTIRKKQPPFFSLCFLFVAVSLRKNRSMTLCYHSVPRPLFLLTSLCNVER